jgi:hypothetical protein
MGARKRRGPGSAIDCSDDTDPCVEFISLPILCCALLDVQVPRDTEIYRRFRSRVLNLGSTWSFFLSTRASPGYKWRPFIESLWQFIKTERVEPTCYTLHTGSHTRLGSEVLTAVVMKSSIFWDTTTCSPLKVNRRFGATYGSLLHESFLLVSLLKPEVEGYIFLQNGLHSVISQKI